MNVHVLHKHVIKGSQSLLIFLIQYGAHWALEQREVLLKPKKEKNENGFKVKSFCLMVENIHDIFGMFKRFLFPFLKI